MGIVQELEPFLLESLKVTQGDVVEVPLCRGPDDADLVRHRHGLVLGLLQYFGQPLLLLGLILEAIQRNGLGLVASSFGGLALLMIAAPLSVFSVSGMVEPIPSPCFPGIRAD